MSIKEMIKDHPQVGGDSNEELGEAVKHTMYGAAIMNSCADACLAEHDAGERAQCIRRCLDASDACTAFYRMASRRTGGNVAAIKAVGEAVLVTIEACHAECSMHEDAHCRRCARMCEEVLRNVRKALDTMADAA